MTTFWGVDSAQPANSMVQNQTLFDFITEQCGQPPAFWGRYIGGRFALTAVEEKFLHDRGCRILVGVWIYADVESGWTPTPEWFEGWSDTMLNSQFGGAGGIYGNPHKTNAANFNVPYCNAFNGDPNMRGTDQDAAYIFSSEPEPGCTTAAQAPAFAPDMPPCNPNTVIWQYAENCFGGRVD